MGNPFHNGEAQSKDDRGARRDMIHAALCLLAK